VSEHPKLSKEYAERFRWDQLPIYICLAGIVMWIGMVTVIVLAEHGVPPEEVNELANLAGLLTLALVIGPFIGPAVAIGVDRLR